jgi:endonuclease/exonuclease/phosphatase family metal-dependent hydrolase
MWLRRAILIGMAVVLTTTGRHTRPPESLPANRGRLSVMTYNVLFDHVSARTADAIAEADPDVVCLQETTPQWDLMLIRQLGWRYRYRQLGSVPGTPAGTSILSKYPMRRVASLKPSAGGWFGASIVVVETPNGPVQLMDVHLRALINHGSKILGFFTVERIHERELRAFCQHLRPDLPTLIVGDFNEGNRGRGVRLLKERGMTDALPEFDVESATWHGKVFGLKASVRLDHLVYDRRLKCHAAKVIRAGESDHYPVMGVFSLSRAGRGSG